MSRCEYLSGCIEEASMYWPEGDQKLCEEHAVEVDDRAGERVTIPLQLVDDSRDKTR